MSSKATAQGLVFRGHSPAGRRVAQRKAVLGCEGQCVRPSKFWFLFMLGIDSCQPFPAWHGMGAKGSFRLDTVDSMDQKATCMALVQAVSSYSPTAALCFSCRQVVRSSPLKHAGNRTLCSATSSATCAEFFTGALASRFSYTTAWTPRAAEAERPVSGC